MDVYPQRLWNMFSYWVEKAYKADDQAEVTVLGIDETSSKKGHSYVTVAVDMKQRRVVHAVPGKGADTIDAIATHLEGKGCEKKSDQTDLYRYVPRIHLGHPAQLQGSLHHIR